MEDYLSNSTADEPHTINTIPYDDNNFTFDFMRYAESDENGNRKWSVVVRLIDFDRTSSVP